MGLIQPDIDKPLRGLVDSSLRNQADDLWIDVGKYIIHLTTPAGGQHGWRRDLLTSHNNNKP